VNEPIHHGHEGVDRKYSIRRTAKTAAEAAIASKSSCATTTAAVSVAVVAKRTTLSATAATTAAARAIGAKRANPTDAVKIETGDAGRSRCTIATLATADPACARVAA